MEEMLSLSTSLTLPLFILILLPALSLSTPQQPIKAGFYLSNSNHYLPVTSLNPSLYTHLYYISTSNEDPSNSLSTFSTTLKTKNPSLKTLLSIDINASISAQLGFVNSTLQMVQANGFDGLDLSCQFPNSPSEMRNFALLIKDFRARINSDLTPIILTASVYFSIHIFDQQTTNIDYPTNLMSNNLDWINILSFGFYKSTNVTVFDAPLFDKSSHFSASYGIISWIDSGVPANKLVMGIPLYGRSYDLKNKSKNGLDVPVVADGPKQKKSNRTGMIAFFEIEELLMDKDAIFMYDNKTESTYFYLGDLWVSFDGTDAIKEKIDFSSRYNLKGYFLWPVNYDDSNYTISKLALEVWNKNSNTTCIDNNEGKTRFKQASSPLELPPLEIAPTQYTVSESSKYIEWPLKYLYWNLIWYCMLCLIY